MATVHNGFTETGSSIEVYNGSKVDVMESNGYPKVVALIPDGNRRWARKNLLNAKGAYDLGVKKFIEFSEWCYDYGVKDIIVWGLSTENTGRPKEEVEALYDVYRKAAHDKKLIARLEEKQARLVIVGDMKLLPKDLSEDLHKLELRTMDYKARNIYLLLGYGGKEDIMHVADAVAAEIKKGNAIINDEKLFRNYLLSKEVPDIDLVIRTSGEVRLSGFMPWQSAYAEFYFCKKYWPDFTKNDFDSIIEEYSKRERRFGV
ncbi:MAG: polyprenyl diphosphate synthase [Candidatus Micrarchaeia archaeon]